MASDLPLTKTEAPDGALTEALLPVQQQVDDKDEDTRTINGIIKNDVGQSDVDGNNHEEDPPLVGVGTSSITTNEGTPTEYLVYLRQLFLPEPIYDEVNSRSSTGTDLDLEDENGLIIPRREGTEPDPPVFYFDSLLNSLASRLSSTCMTSSSSSNNNNNNQDFAKSCILLVASAGALQACYLAWGYYQELIMTTTFIPTESNPGGHFPSATFCVWTNRLAAMLASSVVVLWRHGVMGCFRKAPLRVFSVCAITNTLSSYFQYASLRSISFTIMTVARCCKVAVVMLVGKLLHKTNYPWEDYAGAIFITIGAIIFSSGSARFGASAIYYGIGSLWGYLCIILYLFCDAFTSQWQEKLYQTYGRKNIDPVQMMLGTNIFGFAFTSIGLLCSGDLGIIFEFLKQNPVTIKYLGLIAVASSMGQFVIFFVIREFGPVVFTIVMTVRTIFAIVLSSIMFHHAMSGQAIIGGVIVFGTVAYQISRNYFLARQPETLVT